MSDPEPMISFVIPAFNEERHLPDVLSALTATMEGRGAYEIIVADHGSTDATAAIARRGGARVIEGGSAKTIAELRNRAAAIGGGDVLVFIDADVLLPPEWGALFEPIAREIRANPNQITGARLAVAPASGWVARTWFTASKAEGDATHVGSGQMITSRRLFDGVGGFPADLETGEDYGICAAARTRGARIWSAPRLVAYHLGAPKGVAQFWRRELWHGKGDVQSIGDAVRSPVVWGSAGFVAAHLAMIGTLVAGLDWRIPVGAAALIVGLVWASAFRRLRSLNPVRLGRGMLLFYLYYWARAVALAQLIRQPHTAKRVRA